jgi:hypothetical protein
MRMKQVKFEDVATGKIISVYPIDTYPTPWKAGEDGVYDNFGYRIFYCELHIAKIVAEAVNDRACKV